MEFRHYYLAKELQKENFSATLFSGSYSHLFQKTPKTDKLFTEEWIDGIQYFWVKLPKYKTSASFARVWNMIVFTILLFFFPYKKLKKPDTIVVSSPSLFPVLNGYYLAKKYKTKFIFEIRDLWPIALVHLNNLSSSHPLVRILKQIEFFAYKNSDVVISTLPISIGYCNDNKLPLNKLHIIPNGVTEYKRGEIENLPESLNKLLPSAKFLVGYTGSITTLNAIKYLLEAAKLLENNDKIFFVIIGDGDKKKELQEEYGKLNNVLFPDKIKKSLIPKLLTQFDAAYIGSLNRELYKISGLSPNKLYDYMFAERPVIFSVDSINDIVQDADCGISILPEDPQLIVNAILKLYNLTLNERITLGKNGKLYIENNCTYTKLAQDYIKFL